MATRTVLRSPSPDPYAHLEPLPDPPRIRDMQQYTRIAAFDRFLHVYFGQQADVLIAGGGYLRNEAGNDAERLAPDFVLEVASRSTGRRDYTVKRAAYAGYGVREYWRFDHTGGRYHDAALAAGTTMRHWPGIGWWLGSTSRSGSTRSRMV